MDQDDLDLKTAAEDILARLNAHTEQYEWSRPVFIEFAGTPKSGKSTCIDIVAHFFRRVGFRVLWPAEGASRRTPYFLRQDWMAFNTWSATYALMHVLEGEFGSDRFDLAILDRGLFDALAWFELLENRGDIKIADRDAVQNFLLVSHWRSKIDKVFLFTTDPMTALDREHRNTLIEEPGSAMNDETLSLLNDAYMSTKTKHENKFTGVTSVDTSGERNTNPKTTAEEIVREILSIIDARLSTDFNATS